MSRAQDISDMLTPVIHNSGFILWDITVTKTSKRQIVTITLDKIGGANVDEIAEISKAIAPLLDDSSFFNDEYNLEISTPGLQRSLKKVDHFQWALGKQIAVSYRDQTLARTLGKLIVVTDTEIVIEKQDSTQEEIAIDSITKANTIFDYEAEMKKGSFDESEELQGEIA